MWLQFWIELCLPVVVSFRYMLCVCLACVVWLMIDVLLLTCCCLFQIYWLWGLCLWLLVIAVFGVVGKDGGCISC